MRGNSKMAIVDAAISLFNTKGFQGTTIRDIAGKANVNIANISYYFKNKNGLLEFCFTQFYEDYMKEIEKGLVELEISAYSSLKKVIENILFFQSKNIHITRFILRELSLDTQMVREMMSTYLVKERYYFSKVLEKGMETKEFHHVNMQYFIIQLKGLLCMPFLNSHYVSEVLHILPHEGFFAEKYTKEVLVWLDHTLIKPANTIKEKLLVTYSI